MLLIEFPDHPDHECRRCYRGERNDEVRLKPVVLFPLVQNHLQGAEAQRQQCEPDEINPRSPTARKPALTHEMWRILNHSVGQKQREDSHRYIDEENPTPVVVVGNPSTERRAQCRRRHDSHSVDRERHPPLLRRKGVRKDTLLAWLQTAATCTLQPTKNDKNSETRREAA